jgi:hypothetical protein
MELNHNGLPKDAIHVSGLSGDDGGIVKLNAVSQVDVVFSHSWLIKSYVPYITSLFSYFGYIISFNIELLNINKIQVYKVDYIMLLT